MLSPRKEGDLSLLEALDKKAWPTLLQVTRDCKLKGEAVLCKGQHLTVLERRYVDLIMGRDWNNQIFRLNTDIVKDYLLDTITEFHPENIDDVKSMVTYTDFIQVKRSFEDNYGITLNRYEKLQYCEFLDENAHNIVLKTKSNEKICLDTSTLIDKNYFVFVKVKETIQAQTLLRAFEPQTVHFRDLGNGISLPLGNVRLESVSTYDVIFTVSIRSEGYELMYETFPVDKRIRVNLVNRETLKHVEIMGPYNSERYQEKLMEVNFLMFYQIYSPRYYGYLKVENYLYESLPDGEYDQTPPSPPTKPRRPSILDFSKRKSKTLNVFSSVRKGINGLLKHSPVKEETYKLSVSKTNSDSKSSTLESPQRENVYTSGSYRLLRQRSLSQNDNVVTSDLSNTSSSNTSPSQNAYKPDTSQDTLQARDNCLYGMDTLTLNEIKQQLQREGVKPRARISSKELKFTDLSHRTPTEPFRPIFSQKSDQEIFFQPNQDVTTSNVGDNPNHHGRSPSMPVRRVGPKIPDKPKRLSGPPTVSYSPPSNQYMLPTNSPPFAAGILQIDGIAVPRNEGGADSGIDSPEIKKSVEQIGKEFNKRFIEERSKKIDFVDISAPFNFKHLSTYQSPVNERLYQIPVSTSRKNINRDSIDLDSSNSFAETNLARSKSEPLLNDPSERNTSSSLQPPIYEDVKYERVRGRDWAFIDSSQRRELSSLKEIKLYSIPKVVEMLEELKLEKHAQSFVMHRVNGSFLVYLSEKDLEELNLTKFEACKLYKHIHGWRTNTDDIRSSVESLDEVNVKRWSVNDVVLQMQTTEVNLPEFAEFCEKQQVDGTLLSTLVMKKVLPTLSADGVKLTDFECKRLRMYVCREVKYSKEDKEYLDQLV